MSENTLPLIHTKGSAGADLAAANDVWLWAGETKVLNTGYIYSINSAEYVGDVRPRSSISKKGLLVHYGTIDSDYCGHEVKVTITNLNREGNIKINKGDRVAQLVVVPCHTSEWFTTKEEERTGGHGSTGE